MWLQLAFYAISLLLVSSRIPRSDRTPPRGYQEFKGPTSTSGRAIPVLFGTKIIDSPNIIWWGHNKSVAKTVRTGGGLLSHGRDQVVAYEHTISVHFALCLGPIDGLIQIYCDDRIAVETGYNQAKPGVVQLGRQTWVTGYNYSIASPDFFGGTNNNGGLIGTYEVLTGSAGQGHIPFLREVTVNNQYQPNYRGVATVLFKDMTIGYTNVFPRFAFTAVRILRRGYWGWEQWYKEKAIISSNYTGHDGKLHSMDNMNPAHIIRECLTDEEWGMGYTDNDIDETSFRETADILYQEKMGMSILWDKQTEIKTFIQSILEHIDADLYVHANTGKFVLKAIRAYYTVPDGAVVLDETNVVKVSDFKRSSPGELVSSVTVVYSRVGPQNETATYTAHNLALKDQIGEVSVTKQYTGFTSENIARTVAERDLRSLSTPLASCTIECNRTAARMNIGDIFILRWPQLLGQHGRMVMRVANLNLGTMLDGKITITAMQDVFSLPLSWANAPSTEWEDPSQQLTGIVHSTMVEAPWYFGWMGRINNAARHTQQSSLLVLASKNRDSDTYFKFTDDKGQEQNGVYQVSAELLQAIDRHATQISVVPDKDFFVLSGDIGKAAFLGQNEMVQLVQYDSNTRVLTVRRGCCDTYPQPHAAGERVWLLRDFQINWYSSAANARDYYTSKIRPCNNNFCLPFDKGTTVAITTQDRRSRPYGPSDIQINGKFYPEEVGNEQLRITWKHRNALYNIYAQPFIADGPIPPEANVRYNVQLFLGVQTTAPFRTVTGIEGTSTAFDLPSFSLADGTYLTVRIEAQFTDGARKASFQPYIHTFKYAKAYVNPTPPPTPQPQPQPPGGGGTPQPTPTPYLTERSMRQVIEYSTGNNEAEVDGWDGWDAVTNGASGQGRGAAVILGGKWLMGNEPPTIPEWWKDMFKNRAEYEARRKVWWHVFDWWAVMMCLKGNTASKPLADIRQMKLFILWKGKNEWEEVMSSDSVGWIAYFGPSMGKDLTNWTGEFDKNGHQETYRGRTHWALGEPDKYPIGGGEKGTRVSLRTGEPKPVTHFTAERWRTATPWNIEGVMVTCEARIAPTSPQGSKVGIHLGGDPKQHGSNDADAAWWYVGFGLSKVVELTRDWKRICFANLAGAQDIQSADRVISHARFLSTKVPMADSLDYVPPVPQPPTPQPQPQNPTIPQGATLATLSAGRAINAVQIKYTPTAANGETYRVKFVVIRDGTVVDDSVVEQSYQNLVAEREWTEWKDFPAFLEAGTASGYVGNVAVGTARMLRDPIGTVAPYTEAVIHKDNMSWFPPGTTATPNPSAPGTAIPGTLAGLGNGPMNVVWIRNKSDTNTPGYKTIQWKVYKDGEFLDDWDVEQHYQTLVSQREWEGVKEWPAIVKTEGELPSPAGNYSVTTVRMERKDVRFVTPYYQSAIHEDKLNAQDLSETRLVGSAPLPTPPNPGGGGGSLWDTYKHPREYPDTRPAGSVPMPDPTNTTLFPPNGLVDIQSSPLVPQEPLLWTYYWAMRYLTGPNDEYTKEGIWPFLVSDGKGGMVYDIRFFDVKAMKWLSNAEAEADERVKRIVDIYESKGPDNVVPWYLTDKDHVDKLSVLNTPMLRMHIFKRNLPAWRPYYQAGIHPSNIGYVYATLSRKDGGAQPTPPQPSNPVPAPKPPVTPGGTGGGTQTAVESNASGANYVDRFPQLSYPVDAERDAWDRPVVLPPPRMTTPAVRPGIPSTSVAVNVANQAVKLAPSGYKSTTTNTFWCFVTKPTDYGYGGWIMDTYYPQHREGSAGKNDILSFFRSADTMGNAISCANTVLYHLRNGTAGLNLWPSDGSIPMVKLDAQGRPIMSILAKALTVIRFAQMPYVCSEVVHDDNVMSLMFTDGNVYSAVFVNNNEEAREVSMALPNIAGWSRRYVDCWYVQHPGTYEASELIQGKREILNINSCCVGFPIPPRSVFAVRVA